MAIIKSISPKIKTQTHLTEALSYITQDKKASDVYYHRCAKRNSVAQLANSFEQNRIAFDKNTGRLAVHICQSFSPDDNVTPEAAHEIGIELINRCFPDYQVVMATHNDRDHLQDEFCQGYFLPNLLLFSFAIQPKADDAFYAKVKSAFLADDNMWSVYYEWFCLRVTESHPRKHRQGYLM